MNLKKFIAFFLLLVILAFYGCTASISIPEDSAAFPEKVYQFIRKQEIFTDAPLILYTITYRKEKNSFLFEGMDFFFQNKGEEQCTQVTFHNDSRTLTVKNTIGLDDIMASVPFSVPDSGQIKDDIKNEVGEDIEYRYLKLSHYVYAHSQWEFWDYTLYSDIPDDKEPNYEFSIWANEPTTAPKRATQ